MRSLKSERTMEGNAPSSCCARGLPRCVGSPADLKRSERGPSRDTASPHSVRSKTGSPPVRRLNSASPVATAVQAPSGAGTRLRTLDPRITNPVLYHLSYTDSSSKRLAGSNAIPSVPDCVCHITRPSTASSRNSSASSGASIKTVRRLLTTRTTKTRTRCST